MSEDLCVSQKGVELWLGELHGGVHQHRCLLDQSSHNGSLKGWKLFLNLIVYARMSQDWSLPCLRPSSLASSPLGKADGNPFLFCSSNSQTSCSEAELSWYAKRNGWMVAVETHSWYLLIRLTRFLASDNCGWGNSAVAIRGSAWVCGFQ